MQAARLNSSEKSNSSPSVEKSRVYDRKGSSITEANPIWQEFATNVAGFSGFSVQTKLSVGSTNDEYEREADSVADQVMRMPSASSRENDHIPFALRTKSLSGEALTRLCDESESSSEGTVQTKEKDGTGSHNLNSVQSVISSSKNGAPLSNTIRDRVEPLLGADLSGVRVHNDMPSQQAASSINAKAFTHNNKIYLGVNQSGNDLSLMAHEATHTIQQSNDTTLRRVNGSEESSEEAPYPIPVGLAFSLSGIYMQPRADSNLRSDIPLRRQYAEMLAAAVAGDRYTDQLGLGLHSHLEELQYSFEGPGGEGTEGQLAASSVMIDLFISIAALDWLSKQLRESREQSPAAAINIAQERLDLLILGVEVGYIWQRLNEPGVRNEFGIVFPEWYSLPFFRHEMAHRREALMNFREARLREAQPEQLLFELGDYAMESAEVLTFIRNYEPLFGDVLFREMWRLPDLEEGETPTGPSESQEPDFFLATSFITFARSQPGPFRGVIMREERKPDPRQEIWDRYVRYRGRVAITSTDIRDQILSEGYSDRNADPLPATLSAVPQLSPPFFDIATDTDHAFVMDVTFSDIYEAVADAFGGFTYIFEIIRVEDDSLENVSHAAESESGETAGWGQVWRTRMARQARYLEADLETAAEATIPGYDSEESHIAETILRLQLQMGPMGQGVSNIVSLNAAIRAIGEIISTFFLMLTTPRYERRLVFPNDGLFVVRAICTPELKEESEFRRAPSIAWLPVWARSAATMARMRAEADIAQMLAQELALAEVSTRLDAKNECDEEYEQLLQEQTALSTSLYGTAAEVLEEQRRQLNARKAVLESGADDTLNVAERRAAIQTIDRSIRSINERLEVRREDRNTSGRLDQGERIIASFVSDTGQVTRPLLEAAELSVRNGRFLYYISDLTTENSGEARGSGRSRADAIEDALENLFEHYNAYGRGQLTAFIPSRRRGTSGEFRHIRVDADFTALGLEAIENITTIISVAAMVTAPFTGGASLAILLPVGIIGSTPAAYRVADRASAGTLRMDMQTAMDLVDILGSVASAGETVSGSLRMFRTVKFLGFLGAGADGLGIIAVNWQTIEELRNLPPNLSPGERRLHIMRVLGGAMQANGMSVGGQLLARAYSPHIDADPSVHPEVDTPRPDVDESGVSRHDLRETDTPPPRSDPEMSAQLPRDLAGRVPVEIDENLAQSGSSTVHVTYALDSWGLVTDIRIRRAPGASIAEIEMHFSTVRRMRRYVGLSGWIRNLVGRLSATVGIGQHIEVGSILWEARLELLKLPEVIQGRMEQMQRAIDEGRSADAAAIDADIAFLERQLASHQRTVDDAVAGSGRGYVAAESDLVAFRELHRARRGTNADRLTTIPENWSGTLEARWHALGQAREGYVWDLRQTDDAVEIYLKPLDPEAPTIEILHDQQFGTPVLSPEGEAVELAPDSGRLVYRADDRLPAAIAAAGGFAPRTQSDPTKRRTSNYIIHGESDGMSVSTSRSLESARTAEHNRGIAADIVYVIDPERIQRGEAQDANDIIGPENIQGHEDEDVFVDIDPIPDNPPVVIPNDAIVGVFIRDETAPNGWRFERMPSAEAQQPSAPSPQQQTLQQQTQPREPQTAEEFLLEQGINPDEFEQEQEGWSNYEQLPEEENGD